MNVGLDDSIIGPDPSELKLSARKRKVSSSMMEIDHTPLNLNDVSITARNRIVKGAVIEDQFILKHVHSKNFSDDEGDIQTVRAKISYCLTDRKLNKIKGPDLPVGKRKRKKSHFEMEMDELRAKKVEEKNKEEQNQKEVDEDEGLCFICFANPSNCVFLDCGHGGVCLDCAMDTIKKNNICSLCRETVV